MLQAIRSALTSRRTLAVTLLGFSSGLPLGLVWIAIPDWMRSVGTDIRIVGLITLAHAPWTFKMLWSPLMDRYVPPFLGRRRGWIVITQVALFGLTLLLSPAGRQPDAPWVLLALATAIAIASASQDIVIDAYTVDVLRKDEQGVGVGARIAAYRVAMFVAGALSITLAGWFSWSVVTVVLASLYVVMMWVTWRSPEPEVPVVAPASIREAVWLPFLGFLSRHRSLQILAFVLLYKLSDNLSQSLLRPFLIDMGYTATDRGVALGTVGVVATILGTFLGGALTNTIGLGRGLWIFGLLQIFSNVGYILVAQTGVNRPLMYSAMTFEMVTTGLGMGAFGVLLLRLTQKRFSATQYALFSSLFALPRMLAGPVTGYTVYAVGWTPFFLLTMVAGIPGLVMLALFVPWGERDPVFTVEQHKRGDPVTGIGLAVRGIAGGLVGLACSILVVWGLKVLELAKDAPESGFAPAAALAELGRVESPPDLFLWLGLLVFSVICGLLTAATVAARHGELPPGAEPETNGAPDESSTKIGATATAGNASD